jgi:N,N'-diacetyllegionaminate synthase
MTKTLIIAEAGVNHNGDINLARQLIDVAAEAGADLVKFQTFSADRLVTKFAKMADYQQRNTESVDSQHVMLRKLELTEEMHELLVAHCEKRSIGFFSTGFDVESIDYLAGLGQKLFKIPSGEITNLPYLRHVGRLGKPVILSTGMSNIGEVEAAIEALELSGVLRDQITVLHCTSQYPAPIVDVNLRAMQSIRAAFNVAVGYSDHTEGIEIAIAAVAMGASIIEKHFTLNRNLPGPDHAASLEPLELQTMVGAIRNVEIGLGDGIKRISTGEMPNRSVSRKSIVASQDIKAGDMFTEENITTKRPGTGISSMQWDHVLGSYAARDFLQDDLIEI